MQYSVTPIQMKEESPIDRSLAVFLAFLRDFRAISEAVSSLRDIKLGPAEYERGIFPEDIAKRLLDAEMYTRYRRIFSTSLTGLHALDPEIKSLVSRHRERFRKATFLELVQLSKAEGDGRRARKTTRSTTILQQRSIS